MRFTYSLVLALAVASPSVAQSEFVRDAGAYAVLDALDAVRLGDDQLEVGGGVGWRIGNGLDVGVRAGVEHTSFDEPDRTLLSAERRAIAVEVGYAARLGPRNGLRLGVQGHLQQTVEVGAPSLADGGRAVIDRGNLDRNAGGAQLSAAVFRRVAVRGIAVQPAVGAFWGGVVQASAPSDRPFTLRADTGTSRADAQAGVTLDVPVLFRVGGLDLALVPRVTADVAGDVVGGRLHLRANF